MIKFNRPSDQTLKALWPYQKTFQGITSYAANAIMGEHSKQKDIAAVGKCGGGVMVNNKEILIYEDKCSQVDRGHSEPPTAEESATAAAIEAIFFTFDPNRVIETLHSFARNMKMPPREFNAFMQNDDCCDPLTRFFNK